MNVIRNKRYVYIYIHSIDNVSVALINDKIGFCFVLFFFFTDDIRLQLDEYTHYSVYKYTCMYIAGKRI